MPPTLTLEIFETRRFTLDCVLYGLNEDSRQRAIDILISDPAIGQPHGGKAAFWIWEFGEFDVIYAISADFSKLVLLELLPHADVPATVTKSIFDVIERIKAVKRLFGL